MQRSLSTPFTAEHLGIISPEPMVSATAVDSAEVGTSRNGRETLQVPTQLLPSVSNAALTTNQSRDATPVLGRQISVRDEEVIDMSEECPQDVRDGQYLLSRCVKYANFRHDYLQQAVDLLFQSMDEKDYPSIAAAFNVKSQRIFFLEAKYGEKKIKLFDEKEVNSQALLVVEELKAAIKRELIKSHIACLNAIGTSVNDKAALYTRFLEKAKTNPELQQLIAPEATCDMSIVPKEICQTYIPITMSYRLGDVPASQQASGVFTAALVDCPAVANMEAMQCGGYAAVDIMPDETVPPQGGKGSEYPTEMAVLVETPTVREPGVAGSKRLVVHSSIIKSGLPKSMQDILKCTDDSVKTCAVFHHLVNIQTARQLLLSATNFLKYKPNMNVASRPDHCCDLKIVLLNDHRMQFDYEHRLSRFAKQRKYFRPEEKDGNGVLKCSIQLMRLGPDEEWRIQNLVFDYSDDVNRELMVPEGSTEQDGIRVQVRSGREKKSPGRWSSEGNLTKLHGSQSAETQKLLSCHLGGNDWIISDRIGLAEELRRTDIAMMGQLDDWEQRLAKVEEALDRGELTEDLRMSFKTSTFSRMALNPVEEFEAEKRRMETDAQKNQCTAALAYSIETIRRRRAELTERCHRAFVKFCELDSKIPLDVDRSVYEPEDMAALEALIKMYLVSRNWHDWHAREVLNALSKDLSLNSVALLESEIAWAERLQKDSKHLIKQFREGGSPGAELERQLGFNERTTEGDLLPKAKAKASAFVKLSTRTYVQQSGMLWYTKVYLHKLKEELAKRKQFGDQADS